MMRVARIMPTRTGFLWEIAGLPLAVSWPERGMPLYLQSFPWPGDEQGICEPVGAELYMSYDAASTAAHRYVAGLPG